MCTDHFLIAMPIHYTDQVAPRLAPLEPEESIEASRYFAKVADAHIQICYYPLTILGQQRVPYRF